MTLLRIDIAEYRARVALSVGSNQVHVPPNLARHLQAGAFVAVTAGLGYGFDSYAVNIYGLVLPEIKQSCTSPTRKPDTSARFSCSATRSARSVLASRPTGGDVKPRWARRFCCTA